MAWTKERGMYMSKEASKRRAANGMDLYKSYEEMKYLEFKRQ